MYDADNSGKIDLKEMEYVMQVVEFYYLFRSGAPLWIALSVCLSMSHFLWNPYILQLIYFTDVKF